MKRLLIAPAALLLALGACSDDGSSGEDPVDTASEESSPTEADSSPVELDLDEAEGACPYIDSDLLNSITGEDFRFASGASDDETGQKTCAVQTGDAAYPDLTVYLINTEASVDTYEDELADDAEEVSGLGESAYKLIHTEDTGAGPALEMGWYDDGIIFELRYTTPEGTDVSVVEGLVDGFAELATGIADAAG